MQRPTIVWALAAALVVDVLVIFLLTPLGFENRPQTALKIGGYIAIATIFVGLASYVASLVLLFRRVQVRRAAGLAIVASLLFFIPILGDRLGLFFSVPIPPAIDVLEYVLTALLLVTLFLAWRVSRDAGAARASG
jgi:hypothetical protein